MQPLAAFAVVAASVFCAGLFAQENKPDTTPASPVSPANPASTPAPASAASPVSAPVTPVVPVVPVVPVPAVVLPSGPLSRAEMAATSWLAVIDAKDYPLSWRTAANLLQSSVTQPQWESALQTSRLPLGGVKSRTLKAANYSRTVPFAPDGEYVLIEYETRFEFKPLAIEILTTMKDRDNTWKVAGYFIK